MFPVLSSLENVAFSYNNFANPILGKSSDCNEIPIFLRKAIRKTGMDNGSS